MTNTNRIIFNLFFAHTDIPHFPYYTLLYVSFPFLQSITVETHKPNAYILIYKAHYTQQQCSQNTLPTNPTLSNCPFSKLWIFSTYYFINATIVANCQKSQRRTYLSQYTHAAIASSRSSTPPQPMNSCNDLLLILASTVASPPSFNDGNSPFSSISVPLSSHLPL